MTIQLPPREILSNPPPLRVLDLFSGIGGFSLGLERAGMETVGFCEIDPYCRKVLAKHWPEVKIHDDVKQLDGSQYAGAVDVICGGYPCQPFSAAGKQQGEADPRHLWPEMHRIIRQARPRWVIAENVRGHVSLGFDTVASQLEDDGYTVWPFIVPACAVGAPHRRERLWIVAHSNRQSQRRSEIETDTGRNRGAAWLGVTLGSSGFNVCEPSSPMADPMRPRGEAGLSAEGYRKEGNAGITHDGGDKCGGRQGGNHWAIEPAVGRVAHGIPDRAHRLKALGNAVVPQIPELIGRTIIQYEQRLAMAA